jgi:hypothetical protein
MPRPFRSHRPKTHVQIAIAFATIAGAGAAAYGHGGHAHAPASKPTPDEIAAFEAAKPAFERHCFRCHTSAARKSKPKALEHINMGGYPFGGYHAGEAATVVRKALGADGKSEATMPSDDRGAVTGNDLAKILAWADAFDRAHPSNHPSKHPNTAKESTHAH